MPKSRLKWFVERDGQRQGPFRSSQISRLAKQGVLLPTDLLWKEGMREPVPARDLSKLFRRVPTRSTLFLISGTATAALGSLLLSIAFSPLGQGSRSVNDSTFDLHTAVSLGGLLGCGLSMILGIVFYGKTCVTIAVGSVTRGTPVNEKQELWAEEAKANPYPYLDTWREKQDNAGDSTPHFVRLPSSVVLRRVLFALLCFALLVVGWGLWGLRKPLGAFPVTPVSGKVLFSDGTPIPVEEFQLTFYPQVPPKDHRTFPRAGAAIVDGKTGVFNAATSYRSHDGLIIGKHKVTVQLVGRLPMPADTMRPEYGDPMRTPLIVDTSQQPLQIVVDKPTK